MENFDILIETIDEILKNDFYIDAFDMLKNFQKFLISWKVNIKNVNPKQLEYFQSELSDFMDVYLDDEKKAYSEILSFHYMLLLRYWKKIVSMV